MVIQCRRQLCRIGAIIVRVQQQIITTADATVLIHVSVLIRTFYILYSTMHVLMKMLLKLPSEMSMAVMLPRSLAKIFMSEPSSSADFMMPASAQ